MGSPLGPTLGNPFLVHFEKNWLQNCPSDFKPYYYRQYVDDIFVLFTSQQHLETFQNFLNDRHANMSFTIEIEKQNRMSFLDVQISREDKTFTTPVYRKPTFSGVSTHFDSFYHLPISLVLFTYDAQKVKFSIKDFFRNCNKFHSGHIY